MICACLVPHAHVYVRMTFCVRRLSPSAAHAAHLCWCQHHDANFDVIAVLWLARWATGVEYATEANTWAAAIKAKFPEARVMAVAAHSVANQAPGDRGFTWNSLVYATLNTSVVDGVTVHPYLHLDNVSGGAAPLQPGVPPRQKGQGPTGWYNDSTVQQRVAEFYQSRAGIEALLGVPFFVRTTAQGNLATHTPLPAGLRMIITRVQCHVSGGAFAPLVAARNFHCRDRV